MHFVLPILNLLPINLIARDQIVMLWEGGGREVPLFLSFFSELCIILYTTIFPPLFIILFKLIN